MQIHPVNHPKTGGNKFCGPVTIVHYNWPETFEKFDFFANDYSAYDDSADEDGHISF